MQQKGGLLQQKGGFEQHLTKKCCSSIITTFKNKGVVMNEALYDKWVKDKVDDIDQWVKNSCDEILSAIYRTLETDKHYDEMIDRIGNFVKNKLNIEDDDLINWTNIEEWYFRWYSRLTDLLDIREIEDIFKTLKINAKKWEEPTAKMNIVKIGDRIFDSIKETLEFNGIEEMKIDFLEKY